MSGLFLLYSLSFLPIEAGAYTQALSTAREAAFIQSGIKSDWEMVRAASEKRIPPVITQAVALATMATKREFTMHTKPSGPLGAATWTATPMSIKATISWGF